MRLIPVILTLSFLQANINVCLSEDPCEECGFQFWDPLKSFSCAGKLIKAPVSLAKLFPYIKPILKAVSTCGDKICVIDKITASDPHDIMAMVTAIKEIEDLIKCYGLTPEGTVAGILLNALGELFL